jgi:hypothetical protein
MTTRVLDAFDHAPTSGNFSNGPGVHTTIWSISYERSPHVFHVERRSSQRKATV